MPVEAACRDVGTLEEWENFGVARRRAKVSQLDLAAASGVGQPRISTWEREGRALKPEEIERVWVALEQLLRADVA